MPLDWLLPLVTTLAGGVVGVSGTLAATRLQRNTQLKIFEKQRADALRERNWAERRDAYVRFVETSVQALNSCMAIRVLGREFKANEFPTLRALLDKLRHIEAELTLLGTHAVAECARDVLATALRMAAVVLHGDEEYELARDSFNRARHIMVELMRLDLDGEEINAGTYRKIDQAMGVFPNPFAPGGKSTPFPE
ncbi:hypothetical protein [Micromonospora sp. NPDC051141]|uniref:hypothetical protein n=1 Tax=Micromonospora sp. NPDC051141 TaxID=3364284 RepID=UPI0037B00CFC